MTSVDPPQSKKRRRKPPGFNVGGEIEKARGRAGLSRRELSAVTGISRTVLIGYETGRTVPGAREIALLCSALKVTPNRILFGVEEPFKGQPDALLALGMTDEDAAILPIILLFRMLALEERAAVLTLMRAVLEGRMGKEKFEQAQKALTVAGEWVPEFMAKIDPTFLERLLSAGDAQDDLRRRWVEAGLSLDESKLRAGRSSRPASSKSSTKRHRR